MAAVRARRPRAACPRKVRCTFCPATTAVEAPGSLAWLALGIDGSGGLSCLICPACALRLAAERGEG